MGQAKLRGTRSQRVAQRLGMIERTLSDIKKDLGIPDDAKFLGYGIHLEDSDEFLADFESSPEITRRSWVKSPEGASTFMELSEANDIMRKCPNSVIVGIFDSNDQLWVAVAHQQ